MSNQISIQKTPIDGLLVVNLALFGDERGWFKENWQKEKMVDLGLPDFGPVQNNMAFNKEAGVTRGIHAEPWDKYISVGFGKVFVAIVELRADKDFGKLFTFELTPEYAMFVPKGLGNSYQCLETNTVYAYLVNDYWRPDVKYPSVNLADPELNIKWPIPLDKAIISDKDKSQPSLSTLREEIK